MRTKQDAYRILELDKEPLRDGGNDISTEQIKKQYRLMALKYHPDKSKDVDAKDKFIRIQEAYRFLLDSDSDSESNGRETTPEMASYEKTMDDFLSSSVSPKYALLLKKILRVLSKTGLKDLLRRLNRDTLVKLHELMELYKDAFHIDDSEFTEFTTKTAESNSPENGRENDATRAVDHRITYILNPFIEDLMGDNVFRLKHGDQFYLVPLWHSETVFEDESSGEEFRVCCYPILPENMDIDDYNILSVWLDIRVDQIWNREHMEIDVGGKMVDLPTNLLRFTDKSQEILIMGKGVPLANSQNVFDVSQRQSIRFRIRLSL